MASQQQNKIKDTHVTVNDKVEDLETSNELNTNIAQLNALLNNNGIQDVRPVLPIVKQAQNNQHGMPKEEGVQLLREIQLEQADSEDDWIINQAQNQNIRRQVGYEQVYNPSQIRPQHPQANQFLQVHQQTPRRCTPQHQFMPQVDPSIWAANLRQAYRHYCRTNISSSPSATFDHISQVGHVMSINTFASWCRDFGISLGRFKLIELYKKCTQFRPHMTEDEFMQAIQQIGHMLYPAVQANPEEPAADATALAKLAKYMRVHTTESFHNKMLELATKKRQRGVNPHEQQSRPQGTSKYQFRLHPVTGKIPTQVEEELQARREVKGAEKEAKRELRELRGMQQRIQFEKMNVIRYEERIAPTGGYMSPHFSDHGGKTGQTRNRTLVRLREINKNHNSSSQYTDQVHDRGCEREAGRLKTENFMACQKSARPRKYLLQLGSSHNPSIMSYSINSSNSSYLSKFRKESGRHSLAPGSQSQLRVSDVLRNARYIQQEGASARGRRHLQTLAVSSIISSKEILPVTLGQRRRKQGQGEMKSMVSSQNMSSCVNELQDLLVDEGDEDEFLTQHLKLSASKVY